MDLSKYLIPTPATEGLFSGLFQKNKSGNGLMPNDNEMKSIDWIRKNWSKIVKESEGPKFWVLNPQNPNPEMLWVEDVARRLKQVCWEQGVSFIYLNQVRQDNKDPITIGFIKETLSRPSKTFAIGTVIVQFSEDLPDIIDHKVPGFDTYLWFHSYWDIRKENKLPSNIKSFKPILVAGLHFGK